MNQKDYKEIARIINNLLLLNKSVTMMVNEEEHALGEDWVSKKDLVNKLADYFEVENSNSGWTGEEVNKKHLFIRRIFLLNCGVK